MPASKVILITGCSSGIGRCAAHALASRGHFVCATVRRPESLDELSAAWKDGGERLVTRVLDVTRPETAQPVVDELVGTRGRIDVLINNAAYGQIGAVEELSREELRRQFEVNLVGAVDLIQRVLPGMRERRRGRIINVSSVVAHFATPLMGAYNASKAALNALSDALRMELRRTGIDVVLIEPGVIATAFRENAVALATERVRHRTSVYQPFYDVWLSRWKKSLNAGAAPPELAANAIVHAVEAAKPKTRYRVTLPAKLAPMALALLPDRWGDRLILRHFRWR